MEQDLIERSKEELERELEEGLEKRLSRLPTRPPPPSRCIKSRRRSATACRCRTASILSAS